MTGDDEVTSNRAVRQMEDRIRELKRQLGRKTLEAEIRKEALDRSRAKKPTLLAQSQPVLIHGVAVPGRDNRRSV